MTWLKAAARELFGLFVDDVPFSLAILAWLALATLLLPRLGLPAAWSAQALAAGCLVILVGAARHAATRHRRRAAARSAAP